MGAGDGIPEARQAALRDIEDELGVPVFQAGRGRYGIERKFFLPPLRLSVPEAIVLFLASRLIARWSDQYDAAVVSAFTKLADLASPVLLQTCSSGKTIPKAKLEFMRADGQGERVKYFEIELENVLIGSIKPVVEEGNFLTENVGLKFSKVKWKYTQQKIGGGAGGNTSGGWDLSTNKVV